ncbi:LysE family translocator [Alteromonas oceanisediminis]|uniref:LysE family translocator n=1 Tax=Alteromonas oceanisediminis TaxID=2836180 RepID=UPI001BDAB624|nr:LysE family translocator [Alteromonas oceanisediminis]MBT0586332.1 LysE family translocator [Alteromonas oceanisediminis]
MNEFVQLYWLEFLTIASIHLLAVVSPGPDFAIVVKHSIRYGRQVAFATSIGIGCGILLHIAYSLLGISLVIKTTPWLYSIFSYVAAAYLLWLAWGALRAKPSDSAPSSKLNNITQVTMSLRKGFWIGFLTNGLNPKATLFFMSVFTVVISIQTPIAVQALYGIYLSIATGAWFCLLSFLLSTSRIAGFIGTKGYLLDRAMGVLLVILAANLVLFQPA